MRKILIPLIVGLVLSLGAGFGFLYNYSHTKLGATHDEVILEIRQGESFPGFVHELEKKQILHNSGFFILFAKLRGLAGKMKVGEYAFYTDMTPLEILDTARSGKSIGQNFTVPEGMNIYELAEMWEEEGLGKGKDMLALLRDRNLVKELLGEDHDSFEGYLFPETYQVTKFTEPKKVIAAMVRKFLVVWANYEEQAAGSGMNRHQIVTLASIIEKETGAPEERPLISSVFHNRLKKGMLLQTDPTIIYGKAELSGKVVISITRADLTTATRYNTYVYKGLPPGPIANPSREAIAAALNPETSQYFYFVSKNQGTHIFSKEYADHQAAVRKYQLDAKMREGKSWRDLKKVHDQDSSPGISTK